MVEQNSGVEIFALRETGKEDFDESDIPLIIEKLKTFPPLVIIGHDAKTGLMSNSVGKLLSSKTKIVFCHMAYDNYYPLLKNSADANDKYETQQQIFADADYIFGVGPKLTNYVKDCLRATGDKT